MDELPVPQGSWQKNYDQKQKVYNIQLVVGLITLASTVSYVSKVAAFKTHKVKKNKSMFSISILLYQKRSQKIINLIYILHKSLDLESSVH